MRPTETTAAPRLTRKGEQTRERIVAAAARLIFERGVAGTSVEDVKAAGGKPYAIPAGASVHKFGGLGYVGFAEEVRKQEADLGFKFDYIVVCTVTGSTHAGMIAGFAAQDRPRRVLGIDASAKIDETRAQVAKIAAVRALSTETRADAASEYERCGSVEFHAKSPRRPADDLAQP